MIISSLPFTPHPTSNPPAPFHSEIHGPTNILEMLFRRDGPEIPDVSRYRTTSNIVLSCLTTIFACTWVALHLDVPKSRQSFWKTFWRRFRWMIVALIAPEYISGVAIKERLVAKKYMDEWNANFMSLCSPELVEIEGKTAKQYEHELKDKKYDSRWTLTHGFLTGMGGIRLYHVSEDEPKEFEPDSRNFEDPRMRPIIQLIGLISPEDIEDKSKGDWISKLFIVIQTIWFIVQCLARWATHLPVIELEVVTLAYAVQNIFIYAFWWNKPQSLSAPFRFYVEKEEDIPENQESKGDSKSEEALPFMSHSASPNVVDEVSNSPKPEIRHRHSRRGRKQGLLTHKWVEPTHSGVHGFFIRLFCGDGYWLVFLLAGAIFGSLHLIPIWLSDFPSNAEKTLWKVSALYVTAAPVAGGFSRGVLRSFRPTVFFFTQSARSPPVSVLCILWRVFYFLSFLLPLFVRFQWKPS